MFCPVVSQHVENSSNNQYIRSVMKYEGPITCFILHDLINVYVINTELGTHNIVYTLKAVPLHSMKDPLYQHCFSRM